MLKKGHGQNVKHTNVHHAVIKHSPGLFSRHASACMYSYFVNTAMDKTITHTFCSIQDHLTICDYCEEQCRPTTYPGCTKDVPIQQLQV